MLPGGELPPHQAELAIVAVLSSLTTELQREFTEALSQLHACASHIRVRSGFAGSRAIGVTEHCGVWFRLCKMHVSRKNRKRNLGATPTEGTSHQSGTPGVMSGADTAPRPAHGSHGCAMILCGSSYPAQGAPETSI